MDSTKGLSSRLCFWLPTVLAAIFVPLHLTAWAIILLRVPMGVIPAVWLVRGLVWLTWLVM